LHLRLPRRRLALSLHAVDEQHLAGSVSRAGQTAVFRIATGRALDIDALLAGTTEGTTPCASAT
jgi:hypothetical protein